jgi:hypothetical protein
MLNKINFYTSCYYLIGAITCINRVPVNELKITDELTVKTGCYIKSGSELDGSVSSCQFSAAFFRNKELIDNIVIHIPYEKGYRQLDFIYDYIGEDSMESKIKKLHSVSPSQTSYIRYPKTKLTKEEQKAVVECSNTCLSSAYQMINEEKGKVKVKNK